MAEIRDLDSFVRPAGEGAVSMELAVEGVHCGACIRRIEQGLKKLDGVVDARVNFTNRRLNVVWRQNSLRPVAIVDELDRIGYPAQPFQPRLTEAADAAESKHLLTAIGVAGFAAMNIMLLSVSVWAGNASDITEWQRDFFHWFSAAIAIPAAAYSGQPFFRSAWKALRGGGVNMDVPISLGVILALGLSVVETINHAEHAYFDSAVMLLFFLLCGRYFDHAMRQRTRAVAGNLAALKVEFANRLTDALLTGIVTGSTLEDIAEGMVLAAARTAVDADTEGLVRSTPTIMQRAQTVAAAESGGVEFYLYQGRPIDSTREFCRDREGHVWHVEEIRQWGRDAAAGDGWEGMVEGTDERTIFTHLGGWYGRRRACRHVLVPVLRSAVPENDKARMVSAGLW